MFFVDLPASWRAMDLARYGLLVLLSVLTEGIIIGSLLSSVVKDGFALKEATFGFSYEGLVWHIS
jgi:hypothetical protein